MKVESTDGCLIELQEFGTPESHSMSQSGPESPSISESPVKSRIKSGSDPDLAGKPNLILCHATGFHGAAYAPLAQRLAKHFRVWALDFRGHGSSSAPTNNNFAWTGMTDDLVACISQIGDEPIFAFGHSMGGATVLAAEMNQAGLIRAAYLYEPIVSPKAELVPGQQNPMAIAAKRRREVFGSRAEALSRYAAKQPLGRLQADVLAAYVEAGFDDLADGTVRLSCRAEHEALSFATVDRPALEQLGHLDLKTTIATGLMYPSVPARLAPLVARETSDARLIEHEFLSHFGPLESPDQIAADIISAFAESA